MSVRRGLLDSEYCLRDNVRGLRDTGNPASESVLSESVPCHTRSATGSSYILQSLS